MNHHSENFQAAHVRQPGPEDAELPTEEGWETKFLRHYSKAPVAQTHGANDLVSAHDRKAPENEFDQALGDLRKPISQSTTHTPSLLERLALRKANDSIKSPNTAPNTADHTPSKFR